MYKEDCLVTDIYHLQSVGWKKPMYAMSLLISSLSYAGFPPFIGFFGKILVLGTVLEQGNILQILFLFIIAFVQSIWIFKIIYIIYDTCDSHTNVYYEYKPRRSIVLMGYFLICLLIVLVFFLKNIVDFFMRV